MVIIAIELAAVYVPITPSLRGAAGTIQKELGGVDVARVGNNLGQSLGSRISSAVGTVVKTGALAVGATLAAGMGTALVKGFGRLNAIDTARAKLTGLGNDAATVQKVMENALASVRGTAFGLGDAATVAAQLVAAQIKPGEQLQGVLKSVANAAAAAGTDLNDMGSIYAKVASLGKAQNDVLQQVADRGIPIYQSLAAQMGVTTDEVFKMASAGEIGFAEFESAMTSAAGTVADELGNTVGGAWSNFIASLGRIGAGLLGGVFPQIAPSIKGITSALEPLERLAGTVGASVGSVLAPAMERVAAVIKGDVKVGWITEVTGGIRAMVGAFKSGEQDITSGGFAGVLEGLGVAARAVVDSGILAFATPFAMVMSVLRDSLPLVASALADVATNISVALAGALPGVVQALGAFATVLIAAIAPAVPAVASLVQILGDGLAAVLSFIGPAVGPIAAGVLAAVVAFKLWTGAITAWKTVTAAAAAVQAAFNLVMAANPIMMIVMAIAALVAGLVYFFTQTELGKEIWANFTQFLGEAWNNIVNVATTVFTALGEFFSGVWNAIVTAVTTAWNAIVAFLQPVFDFIGAIISTYIEVWKNIFMVFAAVLIVIWQAISGVVMTVWNAIVEFLTPIIDGIVSFITTTFDAIATWWTGVWNGISSFFAGIWDGIVSFVTAVIVRVALAIRGPVMALASWWTGVWNGISSFFSGIWNGMVGAVSGAVGSIGDFVGGIFDTVMGALSGVGTWLLDSGKALIQGFIDGITGMVGGIGDAVGGVIDWARGFFPNSPAKRGPLSGSGWVRLRHSGAAVMEQFGLGLGDAPMDEFGGALALPQISRPSGALSNGGVPYSAEPSGEKKVVLQVGDREFPAYMREESAGVTAAFAATRRGGRRR